jgi:hypothetical protein
MSIAALITWIITAGFGFFMLLRWATRGGLRHTSGTGTHIPPVRIFTHFGLAAAGLIVWIIYLINYSEVLAWIAFADLCVVATIGLVMVMTWAKDGRAAMAAAKAGATASASAGGTAATDVGARRSDAVVRTGAGEVDLAEQHIPRAPVVLHGIFAVSTLILVLLAALGIGEGML